MLPARLSDLGTGPHCWIAAFRPADVQTALAGGYCQFGRNGWPGPARTLATGDRLALLVLGRGADEDRFIAAGTVRDGDAYTVLELGRERWRRDVDWQPGGPVLLRELARDLMLCRSRASSRLPLAHNRCAIDGADFRCIETALRDPPLARPVAQPLPLRLSE